MNLELVVLTFCLIVFTYAQGSSSYEHHSRLHPRISISPSSWLKLTDLTRRTVPDSSLGKTPSPVPTGLTDLEGVPRSSRGGWAPDVPVLPERLRAQSVSPHARSRDASVLTDGSSPGSRTASSQPVWPPNESPPVADGVADRTPTSITETLTYPEAIQTARKQAGRSRSQQKRAEAARKYYTKIRTDPVWKAKRREYQKRYRAKLRMDPDRLEKTKAKDRAYQVRKRQGARQDAGQETRQHKSNLKEQQKPELLGGSHEAVRSRGDSAMANQRRRGRMQTEMEGSEAEEKEKAKNKDVSALRINRTKNIKAQELQAVEGDSLLAWVGGSARKARTPAANVWKPKDISNLVKPAGKPTLGVQRHDTSTSMAKEASQAREPGKQAMTEGRRRPRKTSHPYASYL